MPCKGFPKLWLKTVRHQVIYSKILIFHANIAFYLVSLMVDLFSMAVSQKKQVLAHIYQMTEKQQEPNLLSPPSALSKIPRFSELEYKILVANCMID